MPATARAALERARQLMLKLRGVTFVESVVIQEHPWFTSVAQLDYSAIPDEIDAAITEEKTSA